MKNKIFKTLFSSLLIFCTLAALTFCAFAEETNAEGEGLTLADEVAQTDGESLPLADEGDGTDETFFGTLYEGVLAHLDEIFCAMTLVSSIFLAFAYKRGLLPVITGTLGKIGTNVGQLGENTASFAGKIEAECERLVTKLGELEEKFLGFEGALEKIEGELIPVAENGEKIERTERTLTEQVEMLYELFMSSALPQYQKDAVAKRIADMRRKTDESEG